MPTGPADKALDLFKGLVFDQLVKLAIQRILGMAAWLSWGPIAFIITRVVVFVADKLYEGVKDYVNIEYIMLRNETYHKQFIQAQYVLKGVASEKGVDSEEFRKARDEHKKALSKFVYIGPRA